MRGHGRGNALVPRRATPTAPSALAAVAASSTAIALTWTDNSTNEEGFRVQRSADSGVTWATAGTVAHNVTSYTDTGLTPETAYRYRVAAFHGSGSSGYSATATATTLAPPTVLASYDGTTQGQVDAIAAPNNPATTIAPSVGGFVVTSTPRVDETWATGAIFQWALSPTGRPASGLLSLRVRYTWSGVPPTAGGSSIQMGLRFVTDFDDLGAFNLYNGETPGRYAYIETYDDNGSGNISGGGALETGTHTVEVVYDDTATEKAIRAYVAGVLVITATDTPAIAQPGNWWDGLTPRLLLWIADTDGGTQTFTIASITVADGYQGV